MGFGEIAICIPSYRRPEALFALLGALEGLVFKGEPPPIKVVVVDNDVHESARPVVQQATSGFRYPLEYATEKRRGIPQARNRAVAAGLDSDWIAFIDDDETPEPHWLERLISTQVATGADVVTGPSLPRFAKPPPAWVDRGRFFEPLRHATGTRLRTAYTNNVLVRTATLSGLERLFDESLTMGVGEDTDLFERIADGGGTIVWCDAAIAREIVPAARASARWIIARGYRVGVATGFVTLQRRSSSRRVPRLLAHGLWCVARGLVRAALGAPRSIERSVSGLHLAAFGSGLLASFLGRR